MKSYRSYTNVPTFELGTKDGETIRDLIAQGSGRRSAAHQDSHGCQVGTEPEDGSLVWGTLPGQTDETIYVIAHRDGWFDAAGDNASGVASMLGLAEYFAKVPEGQRRRTMIFIGTDGHHNIKPGGFGREWLVANREKFFSKTALMINDEHPSEVLTHGGVDWIDGHNAIPSNGMRAVRRGRSCEKIAADAFHEFGVPVWTATQQTPPGGDLGDSTGSYPGSRRRPTISCICTRRQTRQITCHGRGWRQSHAPTRRSSMK